MRGRRCGRRRVRDRWRWIGRLTGRRLLRWGTRLRLWGEAWLGWRLGLVLRGRRALRRWRILRLVLLGRCSLLRRAAWLLPGLLRDQWRRHHLLLRACRPAHLLLILLPLLVPFLPVLFEPMPLLFGQHRPIGPRLARVHRLVGCYVPASRTSLGALRYRRTAGTTVYRHHSTHLLSGLVPAGVIRY